MGFKSNLLSSVSLGQAVSFNNPSSRMLNPNTEPVIEINSDLRKITIPKELYNIAVVGDHQAETIFFNCPRYFDGKDLYEHKCIIRCINAGNEYFEIDVVEMTATSDYLRFGWTLDNCVTRYSGIINFTVQFETVDSKVNYQWQTTVSTLNILPALNIEDTITEKEETLFRNLSNQVQELASSVELLQENNLDIENDIQYLKDNIGNTSNEDVINHINNSDIHITEEDREKMDEVLSRNPISTNKIDTLFA